jgi:hypothetical protein
LAGLYHTIWRYVKYETECIKYCPVCAALSLLDAGEYNNGMNNRFENLTRLSVDQSQGLTVFFTGIRGVKDSQSSRSFRLAMCLDVFIRALDDDSIRDMIDRAAVTADTITVDLKPAHENNESFYWTIALGRTVNVVDRQKQAVDTVPADYMHFEFRGDGKREKLLFAFDPDKHELVQIIHYLPDNQGAIYINPDMTSTLVWPGRGEDIRMRDVTGYDPNTAVKAVFDHLVRTDAADSSVNQ